MNKKEILRTIRDVLQGDHGHQWVAVRKEGRSWKVVASGMGKPYYGDFDAETVLFRHDGNRCTLKEAEEKLERELFCNT